MSVEESKEATTSVPLARLYQARWTLVAVAIVLIGLGTAAPGNWSIVFGGFALIVIVAAILPRRQTVLRSSERELARPKVWPGHTMKSMTEALGFPAYILDRDGVLRYANRDADLAFGRARVGDPISYKFRKPELVRLINESIAKGEGRRAEYQDTTPRDRWFWVDISPVNLAGGAARPDFFLMTFVDFTETKRVEQMRTDFIANASHELRTPLASLRGFVETIKGPAAKDPKAIGEFLDVMLDQAERMSRLIDDLLSLSRIEMKSHVRPSGHADLKDVLQHVSGSLAVQAADAGVSITLDLPDQKLTVVADRDELIQVFENLVENACKYGQAGRKVEISVRIQHSESDGDIARVIVRDFGPGIAAEHLPRLTERFYRVDVESSRAKKGTGLGLAIVKHILTRHGTRLVVSSTPGKGAVFSVSFPLAKNAELVEE